MQTAQKVDRRSFLLEGKKKKMIPDSSSEESVLEPVIPFPANSVSPAKKTSKISKIAKPEEVEEIDLMARPLQKDAMPYYNKANLLFGEVKGEGHSAPKMFITFGAIRYLAVALDRQITVDDLRILLKDEGVKKCFVTKQNKRAISWVFLGKKVTERVARNRKLSLHQMFEKGILCHVGPFFVPERSHKFYFVSGVPFPEKNVLSHLKYGVHKDVLPEWGETAAVAIRIVNSNKKTPLSNWVEDSIQDTLSRIENLLRK